MRYVRKRYKQYIADKAYRIFITDSLQLIPQNKYKNMRYAEIVYPEMFDHRSGDEIAEEIRERLGLKLI